MRDIPYTTRAGVDPQLVSLDIHKPRSATACATRPVLFWVHGGDWRGGDKGDIFESMQLMATQAGYLLVSANYRLSPLFSDGSSPGVTWPAHGEDIAAAGVDAGDYAHTDVFYLLGRDTVVTPPIRRFLAEDCRP